MSLWTASEAVAATGGQAIGDWVVGGVSIDTRTLQAGDLFVALKAARDGHEFVAQALNSGAGAALVDHRPEGVSEDAPLLIVSDVLKALEDLGRAARARTSARVVAVTGSVGKTSTKEMLKAVFEGQGKTHAAVASYNNHWGVPLTLARMPADTEFAVIEIGMNHPGEIAPLARMARPHVAMVTTVAAAHLEAFDSLDGIAQEKASIFMGLEPGGIAVFNGDLETSDTLARVAGEHASQTVTFGSSQSCQFRATSVTLQDRTTVVRMVAGDQSLVFKLSVPGRHFAMNALGVAAVADCLDLDLAMALGDLGRWCPPPGRGTRERFLLDVINDDLAFELIDDAFNANPSSMQASLEVLAAANVPPKGRRIAILGDMLELGETEEALHRGLADLPTLGKVDLVHCVGPRMRALYDDLPEVQRGRWTETAEDLAAKAHTLVHAGDIVLVKGSKGSKVSLVVDAIRKLGHSAPHSEEEGA
jgi:UDP-N-acetylmuramoyl-tripeptide--D-alanyl-D-alanine ligase